MNLRKYASVSQVRDVESDLWDIRDARDTTHGFDLYFGIPANKRLNTDRVSSQGTVPQIGTQAR